VFSSPSGAAAVVLGRSANGRMQVTLNVPRARLLFYMYYPAHLAVLWVLARLM